MNAYLPSLIGLRAVPGHCLTPSELHGALSLHGPYWTTGLFRGIALDARKLNTHAYHSLEHYLVT